ncbi:hypothetical protein DXF93_12220 [Escherichia coli]|nr:hypothetical protein C2U51_20645 [Enterobacteriaceae bacterium ENNIH1]RDT54416.1 hypothetical protein DXF93_12220 [Escherichia coli]
MASLLTPVTYLSKLLGMRIVAAFLPGEIFRVFPSDSMKSERTIYDSFKPHPRFPSHWPASRAEKSARKLLGG